MSETKTPKFDAMMDEILNELIPHSKICMDCKNEFRIEVEDIVFYKMFRVPPPKRCPDCRHKQRLAFANYSNIYKRKCNFPGHTEIMISPVAPVIPWVTYDHETYYGDFWDPMSYGRNIKVEKSFFDQFLELLKVIPQPGVRRGENSINCDYSFYGKDMKDCYYVFGGRKSEDIMFSSSVYRSKHAMDSYSIYDVDTVFNNIGTNGSYKINYGYFSSNCIECDFIFDCRNCQNCFGCVNLRNKNYCWFNEQLTKEEYKKKRGSVDLGSIKTTEEYRVKFLEFLKDNTIRAVRISQSNNCSGEDIRKSNNCFNCFQVEESENLKYASFAIVRLRDSMDVGHSGGAEKIYYSQNCGTKSSDLKFSFAVKESIDCEYLMTCKNCSNCFGCVGLNNASYCIFNKKYEPEEYWRIVDEIKTKMLKDGDYGEYLPMSFSPCAYNSSLANILYPMTEVETKSNGIYWQPDTDIDLKDLKTIQASELPDNVDDVTEELYKTVIIGHISKKPFKIINREVAFYTRNRLPLPTDTPYQRTIDRFKFLNNFKVYQENCFSCSRKIESLYRQSDGYKPLCEQCYQREVL